MTSEDLMLVSIVFILFAQKSHRAQDLGIRDKNETTL